MKLVRSQDLTAYDIPRIESPFFASGRVLHLLRTRRDFHRKVLDLLDRVPFDQSDLEHAMDAKMREGGVLLVHEWLDGAPFSPVVTWQPDESLPTGGKWRLNESVWGVSLKHTVADLNEWGITPDQLRDRPPGSIGRLPASMFGCEMGIRRKQEQRYREATASRKPILPLGASAAVTPLPVQSKASSAKEDELETPPKIHLEVGLFTDGTLNNAANSQVFTQRLEQECLEPYENEDISQDECERRLGLMVGGSYTNAPSNVAKLRDLYISDDIESNGVINYRYSIYEPGVGSKTGSDDDLYGAATGLGDTGVIRQVAKAFAEFSQQVKIDVQGKPVDRLTIDLFGFSRGAAAARHAAHEITCGPTGMLAEALKKNGISWPAEVRIRFVGLFDCVAGIANWPNGDLAAHNDKNGPVKLYLDPKRVGKAVHLTATHEHRKNFALNSLRNPDGTLPDNFREIALPGAHSDIGGGYGDGQREEVLISPLLPVPLNRLRWPEKTMVWDNLEELRKQVAAEGWVGPYNLPVLQSDNLHAGPRDLGPEGKASLEIFTHREAHPAPDGQVELALRMVRQVRGEYSRVSMRLMHQLAVEQGVPLDEIDPTDESILLPEELQPVLHQIKEQVIQGEDAPSLSGEHQDLLIQRYIHYSAHYNSFETLIAGLPIRLRLFRHWRPHAPVSSGERLVYPQQEGQ